MFTGKIWSGDSRAVSIRRAQDNQAIACNDDKFNDYVCMSYQDLMLFYDTYILKCAKWKGMDRGKDKALPNHGPLFGHTERGASVGSLD